MLRLKSLELPQYASHGAGAAFLLVGTLMSVAVALVVAGGFAVWCGFQLVRFAAQLFCH